MNLPQFSRGFNLEEGSNYRVSPDLRVSTQVTGQE